MAGCGTVKRIDEEGEKEKRDDCGDELRFGRQPRRGADW